MAVMIEGMKMPKSCRNCEVPHMVNCDSYCILTHHYVDQMIDSRDPNCPLRERKKGRWIYSAQVVSCTSGDTYSEDHYECSLCNSIYKHDFNFCPYCGAEMEKER